MVGTLCLSGAVFNKAGTSVTNANIKNDTFAVEAINQIEGFLNIISKYDWVANYASLNANKKKFLEEACSIGAAIYAIEAEMSGSTMTSLQRIDSESKVTILYKRFQDCLKLLEKQDYVNYLKEA
jgi:hypothetical protein